ncbi:TonB-dependent receptor plug domain-containing protein [Niabella sp. W65]|nr:TonB-dependent receptor plug domain-containing protein [Niabella sp. W65]MCH7364618.1 TonB-dependent receptor plug domain-containing protein [Niabella sp. W65]
MTADGTNQEQLKDSTELNRLVDLGLRKEKNWRNTTATFTLSGKELEKMFSGNLLNTLQGRIPGLTVNTGSGEPGYDNPNLFMRGRTTWNNGAAQQLILLDGFQVDLSALSAFSPYEIESITLLKDAAATALYGLQGASGVISVATKKGRVSSKNELTINARYGIQAPVKLPEVMNAYDYTRLYNQALANDGLPQKYPDPGLYQSASDPFHPNVNWYDELLKKNSAIQNYNLSFRGGNRTARYYVLMDYMNYDGLYKNATAISKDFGTNAKYSKINLRANVELDLTKSLYVAANVSGIIEDRNTPSGFTASQVFDNLMRIPAASFPVKNPNGTWGNSAVYNFNPIQLLQQNGIYSAHTRTIQTNFKVREKLDLITPGLAAIGGVSFNNQYTGTRQTLYSVMSFELLKDNNDQPVLDGQGNPTYRTIGTNTPQTTNESGNGHWNRNTFQAGLDYNRGFGKHTFSGMVLGRRVNYTRIGQTYAVRVQGMAGNFTYDYDKNI